MTRRLGTWLVGEVPVPRALLVGLVVVALASVLDSCQDDADAHPLPRATSVTIGLHKLCTAVGHCKDHAPRPLEPCEWKLRGETRDIEDPVLDAIVTWECRCENETNCSWFRLSLRPKGIGWQPERRRFVIDYQRRCPSIVCKRRAVRHYYPTLYAQGGQP